ncbi:MAG: hypothetical protein HYX83_00830 [Chloroflexi bacterium]|nr:hypothetical protein [Chloroflexota bacterium]
MWPDKVGGAMVVKNMPGGGSLVATNFVYQAKPDGLTVGTANLGSGVISPVIMGDAGAKYDLKKMNWIGAYLSGGSLVVTLSTAKPYKTVKDLQAAKGLKFASRSPTAASTTYAALFFEVFGIDAKIVTGYQGGADMALAAKRGEVDGTVMPASGLPVYIDAGGLQKPVMNMDFARSEYFPDTPSLAESAKLTPQQESLLRLQNATGASDKAVFAPPGIAEDRVKLMRDAFDKIIGDKGFKTLNEKYFPIWTRPMSGAELTEYIDKTLAIPKSELDAMSALSKKYLAVK